jgi:hypothetical protein
VIDSTSENLLTLAQATASLPPKPSGKMINLATLYRWTIRGVRGVQLESIQVGPTRCTSKQALQRFFERLSADAHLEAAVGPPPSGTLGARAAAKRAQAAAKAGKVLEAMGA